MKPVVHSQSGFALICFLAFVPMIITLFFAFAVGGRALVRQAEMRHLCRTQLLNSQARVAALVTELTALNPQARQLRGQRQAALATLAAVAVSAPHLVPAARSALQATTARQQALRLKQQSLLNRIRNSWQNGARQVRQGLTAKGAQHLNLLRPQVGLIPLPAPSLTPDYLPAPGASRLHRQGATWRITLPTPVTSHLQTKSWNGGCATTLTPREGQWLPQLSEVK